MLAVYGDRHGSILFKFYCCIESVVFYSILLCCVESFYAYFLLARIDMTYTCIDLLALVDLTLPIQEVYHPLKDIQLWACLGLRLLRQHCCTVGHSQ